MVEAESRRNACRVLRVEHTRAQCGSGDTCAEHRWVDGGGEGPRRRAQERLCGTRGTMPVVSSCTRERAGPDWLQEARLPRLVTYRYANVAPLAPSRVLAVSVAAPRRRSSTSTRAPGPEEQRRATRLAFCPSTPRAPISTLLSHPSLLPPISAPSLRRPLPNTPSASFLASFIRFH